MGKLKEIYVRAAVKARCTPQRTEEAEWDRAFEYADQRDLSAAIDAFFERASHSEKGVWMPKVDELKSLIENARRSREAKENTDFALAGWKCPVCHMGCCGYVESGASLVRRCARCGSELKVEHWEAA